MSTYWGYVCQSHDPELESEQWFNHGQERLRGIFAARDALALLAEGDFGTALDRSDVYRPLDWLLAHPRCAVALKNEYGGYEPVLAADSARALVLPEESTE